MRLIIKVPTAFNLDCEIMYSDIMGRHSEIDSITNEIKEMGQEGFNSIEEMKSFWMDVKNKVEVQQDSVVIAVEDTKKFFVDHKIGIELTRDFMLIEKPDAYWIVQNVTPWQYLKSFLFRHRSNINMVSFHFGYSMLIVLAVKYLMRYWQ